MLSDTLSSFCLHRVEFDSPSVRVPKGVFVPEWGAASRTITLVLSRAWVWPGLLRGLTILHCTLGIKTALPLLERAPQASSSLCLPPCLAPSPGSGLACSECPVSSPVPFVFYSLPCSFLFPVQCATPSPPTSPASPTPPINPLPSERPWGADSSHTMRV